MESFSLMTASLSLRSRGLVVAAGFVSASVFLTSTVHGERLENRIAVFSALDKVTATIKLLEVPLNETADFGALKVTPRVCFSRPSTEQPKTTSFVEVDEVQLDGAQTRIFSGWMFAESPGLNAVEHPVFDVWLTDCKSPTNAVAQSPRGSESGPDAAAPASEPLFEPRRRVRR
jgi:hypothetical protein